MSNKALAFQALGLLHRSVNAFDQASSAYESALQTLDKHGGANSTNRRVLSAYRETCFSLLRL